MTHKQTVVSPVTVMTGNRGTGKTETRIAATVEMAMAGDSTLFIFDLSKKDAENLVGQLWKRGIRDRVFYEPVRMTDGVLQIPFFKGPATS
jgi:predicted ATPase